MNKQLVSNTHHLARRARSNTHIHHRAHLQRGFSMLLALGLVALVTTAVMVSLRAVSAEANLQAHERRAREALFAAEAGMAEGRVVVQSLLGASNNYTGVIEALGNLRTPGGGADGYVNETADGLPSAPGNEWYQVIGRTDYTMSRGPGAAIDPGVTTANAELMGPTGVAIEDYPEPLGVHYRVFLVDDADEAPTSNRRVDTNNQVWLVAVGEVDTPGGMPYRTIIRSLVTNENSIGSGGGYCQKGGCDAAHQAGGTGVVGGAGNVYGG
ncbi:hypothetical protein KRR26_12065 [Corallococcus sp. M34]|uniref:hypothetical protein n=1 Tax=Citreicoccus inhibens TaxID=2849499 RepID=UPI001C24610E|nr:hypothetical protein [Citreicoccus inhibens]MBU8896347.1 hypothetical protein [Citreicoccus inhibens]